MRATDRERYWMEGRADAIVDMVAAHHIRPMVRAEDVAKSLEVPYADLVAAVDRRLKRLRRRSMAMAAKRRPNGPAVGQGEKWCPRCSMVKPFTDFHASSWKADGCQPYCKPCRADLDRERRDAGKVKPRHLRAVV